jgi:hypothetical protein
MSEEIVLEVVPDVPVDFNRVVLEVPYPRTINVLSFSIRVLSLTLGSSVRLAVNLECESGGKAFTDYKEVIVQGEEYLGWGADDAYIVELVKAKLESIL